MIYLSEEKIEQLETHTGLGLSQVPICSFLIDVRLKRILILYELTWYNKVLRSGFFISGRSAIVKVILGYSTVI